MPDSKHKNKQRKNNRMKNPKTTSVLVGLGLVLVLTFGYAQGNPRTNSSYNTFINDTGQAVGGLHIQYGNRGCFVVSQNPANTFAVVQTTEGSDQVNLSSGTVAAGGSVQITIANPCACPLRVKKWWWTNGSGILVGKTQYNGCGQPDCTSP